MINFQFNLASISGIVLAVGGAGLYFIRSARPQLSRDYDIFFAAVGLLCGIILILYGWRFDPIMQFGQVLLTASTIFFAFENFRLRGITTEQARRNTPIVDEDRPVSPRYDRGYYVAELEELGPAEERPPARRIRPSRDQRSTRSSEYDEEDRRSSRRSSVPGNVDRSVSSERSRKRRSSTMDERVAGDFGGEDYTERSNRRSSDDFGGGEDYTERSNRRASRNSEAPARPVTSDAEDEPTVKPRKRRRPSTEGETVSRRRSDSDRASSDYADYQPINYSDSETNNPSDWD